MCCIGTPGPLLEHVVETIADGVWVLEFGACPTFMSISFLPKPLLLHAKAPAKALVEHRNALAKELKLGLLGRGASSSAGPPLTEKNAARHYKGIVRKFGLRMNIQLSVYTHVEGGESANLPWIRPSHALKHLLEHYPWLLLGGCSLGPDTINRVETMLEQFWCNYENNHPSHAVFEGPQELRRTIPLALHGDGARTQKKQPLEIISLEAVLGLNSAACEPVDCDCAPQKVRIREDDFGNPLVQKLNQKHHSYLSRYLLVAFASKEYKQMPGLLRALLKAVGDDLGEICRSGLEVSSGHWNFACIGYKGDQEYHSKTGLLTRSYQNVGHVNQIKCCSECEAGDAMYPFEDMSSDASWIATRFQSLPWTTRPPFDSIPFENWEVAPSKAALFLRRDPFHVFRLGIGRNFLASAIILLSLKGLFDDTSDTVFSFERRMTSAWSDFKLWTISVGASPASIRSFSREKLHYKNSFPYVSCKGADTVLLFRWLEFAIKLWLPDISDQNICATMRLVLLGVQQGLAFTRGIHHHGLWLPASCSERLAKACRDFNYAYTSLAAQSLSENLSLFGMVPKFHSMDHFKVDLREVLAASTTTMALNPCAFDCSINEDFVGRVARQSRRIGYRNLTENLFLAYLVKFKFVVRRYLDKKRVMKTG